ncbi:complex I subunit 4 family protein [Actinomyces vulturis]|uniref:complex I subunit 4 family protein n=1 Tax=Actinomyces vulturis TaxID=1857645 RepID=UPI0008351280|nr:NADH-quinone oxidoreductase subunit M [Actinomyces vulturis]
MNAIMSATHILTILALLPLVGSILIGLVRPLRKHAAVLGLVFSGATFVLALWALSQFDMSQGSAIQLGEYATWIPALGVSWALGVNALGLAMILLATFIVPLVLLASRDEIDEDKHAGFTALVLSLEFFMVLIFAARDVFLFYVVFEAMLIPVYFLIGRYGGDNRRAAALKFLLYSLAGGLIMLGGIVGLYVYGPGGETAFLIDSLVGNIDASAGAMNLMFVCFMIAFAIKAPMVPVHTWLPDTAEQATPGTSVLLIGILDKVGTFGMITLCLPLFTDSVSSARTVILVLALISIIYGGLTAIGQDHLYRLISYTSISHFGFMVLGIFIGSQIAAVGAMVYMVAHGLSIAGLFLVTGFLAQRTGTLKISEMGGMQRVTPLIAGTFLISGLASIALPGLSGFVPEWMVLTGTFSVCTACGIIAVFGVVIAALYVMLPYQRVFTGAPTAERMNDADLNIREKVVLIPVIAAMFLLGFLPGALVNVLNPIGEQIHSATTVETATSAQATVTTALEGSVK